MKRAKRIGVSLFCLDRIKPLIEMEVDFNIDRPNRHRLAVLPGWLELVLHHRFNGLFVQPHAQCTNYPRVLRISLRIHEYPYDAESLVLGPARLVGELRLWFEHRNRGGNGSANAPISTTDISAFARPISVSMPRANAHAGPVSQRTQLDIGRVRLAEVRQSHIVGNGNVWLHIDGRKWWRGTCSELNL